MTCEGGAVEPERRRGGMYKPALRRPGFGRTEENMAMWVRLGGALLITLLVLACLEYFGVSAVFGGRAADDVQHDVDSRMRELFWLAIFAVVMVMSVVAAVRRWAAQLRGALVTPQLGRRHVP
jgi:hypothetical protein